MKRTLSLILALALVFACIFAFSSCSNFKGSYKDTYGNTWNFTGSKLKIEGKLTVDKVEHDVVAVYSYKYEKTEELTGTLTTVIEKYKYSGDNAAVKAQVAQMNALIDSQTEVKNTAEYTVTQQKDGSFIEIKKGTVTTKLTAAK